MDTLGEAVGHGNRRQGGQAQLHGCAGQAVLQRIGIEHGFSHNIIFWPTVLFFKQFTVSASFSTRE